MKKILIALISIVSLASCDVLQQLPKSGGGFGRVTEAEAAQGIKEALSQGIVKATLQLNKENGFFGDAYYKILLPEDAKRIENTLRALGLGNTVDKAILQINRGAEDAAGYAQPIFIDAIKQMTLTDAINIVRGGDSSATHYFRTKTMEKLTTALMPVINSSLTKTNATRFYSDIVKTYNNFPTTSKKLNPDLTSFVTDKATNALFNLIAQEEKKIRENPLARTTEILKKVFGGLL